jgi:8-amino-3,8-dideoxy-alpha-D-manno-octulosonate transaminase
MPGFEVIGAEEKQALIDLFEKQNGILFRHGFDALRNGRFQVLEFEREFADYVGAKHALAVQSGTAAVKVALKALGVGKGDEVITQAFTFIATMEAIFDCGAKPIIVNCDETLNMSPAELEAKITTRTKVICPVHMLGVAADLDPICAIARKAGVPVFEENCESLGARYDGAFLGTITEAGAFSFDFGKVITCGEGGMLTTNDEETYKRAREYHDHGHESNPTFPRGRDTRRMWGFNYRMTEMQGAVGIAQLRKLDMIRAANERNYKRLEKGLQGISGLGFRSIPPKCQPLYDTLIINFPTAEQTSAFVAGMVEHKLGTKNIPDAAEWHFAGYWDHMAQELGYTKESLWKAFAPTQAILARSVSLPVMVKETEAALDSRIEKLRAIATSVL